MNNLKKNNQDHFEILRKISKNPEASQRELAEELGFSLGKLNYCIKELQNKGLIKIKNFNKNKKKMKEYDDLKAEINENDLIEYKTTTTKKIDQNLL